MFQRYFKLRLILLSFALFAGCQSGYVKDPLTHDERQRVASLILVKRISANEFRQPIAIYASDETGAFYKDPPIRHGSDNTMTVATFEKRTADAAEEMTACLSDTYGEGSLGSEVIVRTLPKLLDEQGLPHFESISLEEERRFWEMPQDGQIRFLSEKGTHAVLIVSVEHMAGLWPSLPFGRSYEVSFAKFTAEIMAYDREGSRIYLETVQSANTRLDSPNFCSEHIQMFELEAERFSSHISKDLYRK